MSCHNCPRQCPSQPGFCHARSSQPEAASVYAHTGEEPPLYGQRGISNLFFAHCNLQCCYCQNHQISRAVIDPKAVALHGLEAILDATARSLEKTENIVGLVSASHYSDLVEPLVEGLHARGLYPTVVWNSGGYDSVEVLQRIAPFIDIYLPDYKYSDADLAARYSHAPDYPVVAAAALREMHYQKGTSLPCDERGLAFRGLIVRHLVLPGQVQNSIGCLRWIADNLGTNIHLSLMAQYYPPQGLTLPDALGRCLLPEEYEAVTNEAARLGFYRGWMQQLDAAQNYHPHFNGNTLFE